MSEFFLHTQLAQDTFFIRDLKLSQLVLMNDKRFPWMVLVPRKHGASDLLDLLPGEQKTLLDEINRTSVFMKQFFRPEKLNIATIGNIVPQLHIHIVGRFAKDLAWPKPVWGFGDMVRFEEDEGKKLVAQIQNQLPHA